MDNLESNSESNAPEHNRQFFFDAPATATPASPAGKPVKQKRQKTGLTATSALIIGSLVGGGIGGAAGVAGFMISSRPAPIVVNNQSDVSWVTSTAAVALPSVVTISVDGSSEAGTGSGVFLTDSGYILTNTHVVTLEGATSKAVVQVKTTDGHIYDAAIVGTDPANDLAVIKISAPIKFTPIKFADSSKINVGDAVVALGAPLGLESSVTSGVVSALDRTIQVASSAPNQSGTLQWWNGNGAAPVSMKVIQTDASINPGNSGGALVNQRGELVGVNVAIATASSGSSTTGQSGSIGVGFAIPSNVAKRIGNELMTTGKASHGLFGAMVSDNGSAKSAAVGFSTGAKVQKLTSGGAAEKAGILVGDVVTKFDGHLIASSGDLTAAVRFLPAHTKVTVEINRAGKSLTFDVTLGDLATLK
jgi:putative serine protease PepD